MFTLKVYVAAILAQHAIVVNDCVLHATQELPPMGPVPGVGCLMRAPHLNRWNKQSRGQSRLHFSLLSFQKSM